ncbi:metalloregulator ArsR/SmtB family transcription factor [Arthrobacter sp. Br18]|uniref:ArsR/SmtB family transcription factor n=1 Tax=Arthrobacter sp. Br18 TaxID=1312954 RepID=UPI0004BB46FC|nr:metalloregulator ArsR/SmtB family transcription factor [Arthrobacter sp. Br18]
MNSTDPGGKIGPTPSLHHPVTPDEARLEVGAGIFRMLSDPTRLHLLWLLTQGPADVTSLVARTGVPRTSVSQHLAKLRLSGLVSTRKESRSVVYSIVDGHLGRLVMEGMNHADHRVTGEPTHD